MTFNDLKRKEVINVCNGGRLGCVCDIIFDVDSRTLEAIVVPGNLNFLRFFHSKNVIIPWKKICKLGDDVILVDAGELFPK